ncbi:hypothetical protein [Streptomyces sp. NPDC002580]|uniref:hypothetical protein n=1 Tax=Streptomyces sp. NPDC002580 TaxID=3364653 RepID=UPI0036738650
MLYVRDLATGADERISPLPPAGMITGASLPADGRKVAYGLLVRGDQRAAVQIRTENRVAGATRRVDTGDPARLVRLSAGADRVRARHVAQCSHPETPRDHGGGMCQTALVLSFAMIIGSRRAGPQ